ncbi:MAG: peptide-methionine (S)-S-oxide reductase MsrA [bacterium]|nr:peptide-methionine (S)-S-oxide reductase MsrA [bacterium]
MEQATFAAGCFWCAEAALKLLDGVKTVTSGYAGGEEENPSYEEVGSGRTGHVEAVQVTYDPSRVSFERLLKIFWEIHNPLEKNKQGPDTGPQYQAVIFYHTKEQKELAEKTKEEQVAKLKAPVMTEIKPYTNFFPAEAYHKDFFERNPDAPYSRSVIAPKVEKVKKLLQKEHGE